MANNRSKLERIVAARTKLMERHRSAMQDTPSLSDGEPLGSGVPNAHGMPKLPVGQYETKSWPVLDLGILPEVTRADWRLVIDGEVEHPLELDFEELLQLPQTEDVSDFHCVTKWSKFDMSWVGVALADALAEANLKESATHLMCHGYDGYTTNVSLAEALKLDVLLVHTYDGQPLPSEHGGPVRMITPQLYAWKGTKWIQRIEVMNQDRPGFWEERGYSMTAHPWRDDRYS
ncbi:MAG: sulfite oxidase-like oxidoreductase [Myxococcales bacterium]|nr:sulfite oxidase-like oxidoreductase [Myxococcales bacterium]